MDWVDDSEILYRRIPFGTSGYLPDAEGPIRLSKSAFSDRGRRISVDRALLTVQGAASTQGDPRNGVVSLLTAKVRAEPVRVMDSKGIHVASQHLLDVLAAPLEENPAHAEIVAVPELSKAQFHKVQQRLTDLSSWVVLPIDVRSST